VRALSLALSESSERQPKERSWHVRAVSLALVHHATTLSHATMQQRCNCSSRMHPRGHALVRTELQGGCRLWFLTEMERQ
jgi:hypothetical protein